MRPKLTPNAVENGSRKHRSAHNLDDLWGAQGGPKMEPKRTHSGVKNGTKSAPNMP